MEKDDQKEYSVQQAKQFIESTFDTSALPSLIQYIKIPNLSRQYQAEWNQNKLLEKAANHIVKWVESLKLDNITIQIIKQSEYSPLIYIQIEGGINQTVMFYGHYDKQPPFTGWWEGFGPTTPVIKDDKLYGRGGADDGYSTYGSILAIQSLQKQGLKFPRCVLIIQGDQESGSAHLFYYLPKLKQRIGNPLIFFCLDSGALDYQRFWLTKSLRGNMTAIIDIHVLTEGVHSGQASGIVPSSFRILRELLERIENSKTGQIAEIFQVQIPQNRLLQSQALAKNFGNKLIEGFYPFIGDTKPMSIDPLTCYLNKTWKSQLAVTGASGFPEVQVAGNVLLPSTTIKVSLRLPPTLDGTQALKNFENLLTKNVPYDATVKLRGLRYANGWNAPAIDQYLEKAIIESSDIFYGKQQLSMGQGGSIPLMGKLTQIWPKGQFLITGVLGPQSNAHGPNQFLHLGYVKKLICCMSFILGRVSKQLLKR